MRRLPPPSIGVYRQDRLMHRGEWRRRRDEGAASVFFIVLSLAVLLMVYGVMLVGGDR
jgi:hypothetical protein